MHAVNSVGSGATSYSAGYDAAGGMTCRAVGASTCASAPTSGQTLGYDALRRLLSWQNASSSPTQTGSYAYDGSGERVWQQATNTSGGTTTATTTVQVLGVEDVATTSTSSTGGTTIARRTYALPGGMTATRDASGLTYSHTDTLGTPIASLLLDSATVTGVQLRTPYGQARYAANSTSGGSVNGMHAPFGFTGQREDSSAVAGPGASGLDYFHARYYDAVVGRFISADSMLGADPFGDNYAYVGGMVESATDPSGHGNGSCGPVCSLLDAVKWSSAASSVDTNTDHIIECIGNCSSSSSGIPWWIRIQWDVTKSQIQKNPSGTGSTQNTPTTRPVTQSWDPTAKWPTIGSSADPCIETGTHVVNVCVNWASGYVYAFRIQKRDVRRTQRLRLRPGGWVSLKRDGGMLYMSFRTDFHARYYWNRVIEAGNEPYGIRFLIDEQFVDYMEELAVAQKKGTEFEGFPQWADQHRAGTAQSFGLPEDVFGWFIRSILQGTGEEWNP